MRLWTAHPEGARIWCAVVIAAVLTLVPAYVRAADKPKEKTKPKAPITVTSDTMEASRGGGNVIFKGNVAAVEDFTLCTDELSIFYGKEKEVNEMIATGNVRIFQTDRTATAEKATYDRGKRTLVLIGRAQVVQCSDTVKGDRITVHLDDENALVESQSGGRVKAVIMPVKNCPQQGLGVAASAGEGSSEEARCRRSR